MISYSFDKHKAVQAAAYLIKKNGGSINYTLMMKMLYLSDRKSLELYDEPITGDAVFSMNNGPILTTILDWIKGTGYLGLDLWNQYILKRGYSVQLQNEPIFEDLSIADLEILDEIYSIEIEEAKKYFHICDYTDALHERLPEWTNPSGSSQRIYNEVILQALGKSDEQIKEIESFQKNKKTLDRVLGSCV